MCTSQLQIANGAIVCVYLGVVEIFTSRACSTVNVLSPNFIENLPLPELNGPNMDNLQKPLAHILSNHCQTMVKKV